MPRHHARMLRRMVLFGLMGALMWSAGSVMGTEPVTREQASEALHRAVNFFRTQVSVQGSYLWRYSGDLTLREGESPATQTQGWVQPPGTPSVGMAYLEAWKLTGEPVLLEAARETAWALVETQLVSGGWDYRIEFDPQQRSQYRYRTDEQHGRTPARNARNVSTLDDDTTQAALRLLMQVDRALDFQDARIHEAAQYGLAQLIAVQYPNGAWPQRFSEPPDPDDFPVKSAAFPDDWPREWPDLDYRGYYTLNDNSLADAVITLFEAAEIYEDPQYRAAAESAGGFLLLAQLPEPQPAWAQQYDVDMSPAWARRFEPPAVSGGESQGVLQTLLLMYRQTGNPRYLEPVPRALDYLRRSRLPDGRLARFYELQTNRPLYFVKETYELTYSPDNMPTHYAFIVGERLDALEREYQALRETPPGELWQPTRPPSRIRLTDGLVVQTQQVIEDLDQRGAWVGHGTLRAREGHPPPAGPVIDTRTFARNLQILARYLAAE